MEGVVNNGNSSLAAGQLNVHVLDTDSSVPQQPVWNISSAAVQGSWTTVQLALNPRGYQVQHCCLYWYTHFLHIRVSSNPGNSLLSCEFVILNPCKLGVSVLYLLYLYFRVTSFIPEHHIFRMYLFYMLAIISLCNKTKCLICILLTCWKQKGLITKYKQNFIVPLSYIVIYVKYSIFSLIGNLSSVLLYLY